MKTENSKLSPAINTAIAPPPQEAPIYEFQPNKHNPKSHNRLKKPQTDIDTPSTFRPHVSKEKGTQTDPFTSNKRVQTEPGTSNEKIQVAPHASNRRIQAKPDTSSIAIRTSGYDADTESEVKRQPAKTVRFKDPAPSGTPVAASAQSQAVTNNTQVRGAESVPTPQTPTTEVNTVNPQTRLIPLFNASGEMDNSVFAELMDKVTAAISCPQTSSFNDKYIMQKLSKEADHIAYKPFRDIKRQNPKGTKGKLKKQVYNATHPKKFNVQRDAVGARISEFAKKLEKKSREMDGEGNREKLLRLAGYMTHLAHTLEAKIIANHYDDKGNEFGSHVSEQFTNNFPGNSMESGHEASGGMGAQASYGASNKLGVKASVSLIGTVEKNKALGTDPDGSANLLKTDSKGIKVDANAQAGVFDENLDIIGLNGNFNIAASRKVTNIAYNEYNSHEKAAKDISVQDREGAYLDHTPASDFNKNHYDGNKFGKEYIKTINKPTDKKLLPTFKNITEKVLKKLNTHNGVFPHTSRPGDEMSLTKTQYAANQQVVRELLNKPGDDPAMKELADFAEKIEYPSIETEAINNGKTFTMKGVSYKTQLEAGAKAQTSLKAGPLVNTSAELGVNGAMWMASTHYDLALVKTPHEIIKERAVRYDDETESFNVMLSQFPKFKPFINKLAKFDAEIDKYDEEYKSIVASGVPGLSLSETGGKLAELRDKKIETENLKVKHLEDMLGFLRKEGAALHSFKAGLLTDDVRRNPVSKGALWENYKTTDHNLSENFSLSEGHFNDADIETKDGRRKLASKASARVADAWTALSLGIAQAQLKVSPENKQRLDDLGKSLKEVSIPQVHPDEVYGFTPIRAQNTDYKVVEYGLKGAATAALNFDLIPQFQADFGITQKRLGGTVSCTSTHTVRKNHPNAVRSGGYSKLSLEFKLDLPRSQAFGSPGPVRQAELMRAVKNQVEHITKDILPKTQSTISATLDKMGASIKEKAGLVKEISESLVKIISDDVSKHFTDQLLKGATPSSLSFGFDIHLRGEGLEGDTKKTGAKYTMSYMQSKLGIEVNNKLAGDVTDVIPGIPVSIPISFTDKNSRSFAGAPVLFAEPFAHLMFHGNDSGLKKLIGTSILSKEPYMDWENLEKNPERVKDIHRMYFDNDCVAELLEKFSHIGDKNPSEDIQKTTAWKLAHDVAKPGSIDKWRNELSLDPDDVEKLKNETSDMSAKERYKYYSTDPHGQKMFNEYLKQMKFLTDACNASKWTKGVEIKDYKGVNLN